MRTVKLYNNRKKEKKSLQVMQSWPLFFVSWIISSKKNIFFDALVVWNIFFIIRMMQDFSTFLQQRWHSWILKNEHIFYVANYLGKNSSNSWNLATRKSGMRQILKMYRKYIVESLEVRIISCPAPNALFGCSTAASQQ